jgi:hypothetical protein
VASNSERYHRCASTCPNLKISFFTDDCASDTTDEEWAMIAPYMPGKNRRGWPRVTAMRASVNSTFFIAQSGCQ